MVVWVSPVVRASGGLGGPGGDLLFRRLSGSTIGAEGFHGRVRDGIGCGPLAVATRSSERTGGVGMDDRFLCEGSSVLVWCARAGLTAVREVLDQAERAISTGKLNASFVFALTHPAYRRGGLPRLFRETSFRGGFPA